MQQRTRIAIWVTWLVALVLLAAPAAGLRADNPAVGIFELDGNAIDSNANGALPDDWNTLFGYAAGGSGTELIKAFIPDVGTRTNPDDTFTTGGSKDIYDVDQWRWTTGSILDKDDITDAYAALYRRGDGHLIFMYGLDRFANNGDAQIGFWLFQRPLYKVTLTSGPLAGQQVFSSRSDDTDGTYIAHHTIGDVLILCHFTQGGATVSLEVYQWDGTTPLAQLATGVTCTAPNAVVDACCEVNKSPDTDPQTAPWPYEPKSGTAGSFPDGSFFEGGADLTQLLPNAECFSSFLAETRSSQSLSAQLKDLALATQPTCSIEVTKTGPTYSKAGDTATYTYTIHNTGIGTLYLQSAQDVSNGAGGTQDLLTAANTAGCGTLAPHGMAGDSCTFTYDYVVQSGDPDPLTNTATFVYNDAQAGTGVDVTGSDDWSVTLIHPSIKVEKTCPQYAKVGDEIEYTITITNTGDADLVLKSASDTFNPTLTLPSECDTLAVGASCQFSYKHTVSESDPNPLENTVVVDYTLDPKYSLPNVIHGEATCTTTVISPKLLVTKSCDSYARVGDTVHYTITVENTGDVDLQKVSIVDTLLGTLTGNAGCGATLAVGAKCTIETTRVVLETDPDPLNNTVTAVYEIPPAYGSAQVTSEASCATDIIHPAVSVSKSCDEFALVGSTVNYSITVKNDGDVPLDKTSIVDTLLGTLTGEAGCGATLAVGASCTINKTRVVLQSDPDPLPNTVTVHYALPSTYGITADYSSETSCSTDIIHPDVTVAKSCTDFALVGGNVHYTITVTNNGDVPLTKTSISDTLLGSLTADAGCGATLAVGASCTIEKDRTVLETDPTTLNNTVTVHYGLPGSYNLTKDSTAEASCSTSILKPHLTVAKSCTSFAIVGGTVDYAITITNDGNVPLEKTSIDDTLLGTLTGEAGCGATLAVGASCTINKSRVVLGSDPDPIPNTVTAHYGLPASYGITTDVTGQASCSTDIIHPSVTVAKSCTDYATVGGNVHYVFTVTNNGDVPLEKTSIEDTLLGTLTGDAGCGATLAVGASCTITRDRTVLETDPNPIPNTVTVHYGLPASYGITKDSTAEASCSTTIIHPNVSVTKSCTSYALVGGNVHYVVTVQNEGDVPLEKTSISDTLLGSLDGCLTLAPKGQPGDSCVIQADRTVLETDPNPIPNTVTVHYGLPASYGITMDSTAYASCSTTILHPDLKVEKSCDSHAMVGDSVDYTITVTNMGDVELDKVSIVDTLLGDLSGELGCGGTLAKSGDLGDSCTFTVSRVVLETDADPLNNTVTATYKVPDAYQVSKNLTAETSCATDIVAPSFTVEKSCLNGPVPVGAYAYFRIVVVNTGDLLLHLHVVDTVLGIDGYYDLPTGSGTCDPNAPGEGCLVLEAGILVTEPGDLPNDVTVTATVDDLPSLSIEHNAGATCPVVTGGATRTLGFWATHCDYTQHVFNTHLGGTMNIGWKTLTDAGDVFGIFWANNAKDSTGKKRSALCQARETVANQVVAAILNSALSNGKPLPMSLADIQAIMAGSNVTAIRNLGSTLDAYNNSGDLEAIVDNDGYTIQHADPKCSKLLADIPFADCP